MSRRLLQLVMPVFPDRRMFRLHDAGVDPNAPGAPLPPVGSLISVNREQLWVGSLQEQLDVRLVIEEWDGAPPPFGDTWQEEAKCRLYLRGYLSIDEGSVGKAIHGLRLASGVGNYAVRVYASNREEAARRYAELYDAHRNPLADEFQQAKKQLEGLERYLIQLWREYLRQSGDQGPWPALAAGWAVVPGEPSAWCTAAADARDEELLSAVRPEAALAAVVLADAGAASLADLPTFLLAGFLAGFLAGPAPIFGWPVLVLDTVVTGWPDVREPDRKGKIA